jgi:hypothetical protein
MASKTDMNRAKKFSDTMDELLPTDWERLTVEAFEDCNERYKFFAHACTSLRSLQNFLKNEIVHLFGDQVFKELNKKNIRHHIARWCVAGITPGGLTKKHLQSFYTEQQITQMYAKKDDAKTFSKSLENPFNLPFGMSQRFQPDFDPNGHYIKVLCAIDKYLNRMIATKSHTMWVKRRKLNHGDCADGNAAAGNGGDENAGARNDADESDGVSVDADESDSASVDADENDDVEAVKKIELAVEAVKNSVQKALAPDQENEGDAMDDGDEETDGDDDVDGIDDGDEETDRNVAAVNTSKRFLRSTQNGLLGPTYPKSSKGTSSKRRLTKQRRSQFLQVPYISL